MKIVRKIWVAILIVAGMAVAAAILLGWYYEDEITQFVVGNINKRLRTEIDVRDVKLSFLKKFPDASLGFENVFIRSVPDYDPSGFEGNTDTLLYAEHLYLRFNLLKMLRHEYLLREVQIVSGEANIVTDGTGGTNYALWNRESGTGNGNFILELENVKGTDIRLAYDNRSLDVKAESHVRKADLKGKLSEVEYKLGFGMEGDIIRYSKGGTVFLRDQDIAASAFLLVTRETIEIETGDLQLAGQELSVAGNIIKGDPSLFQLDLKGKQLSLEYLLKHLASYGLKIPEGIKAGGILSFDASISGEGGRTTMPGIDAVFSISEGWIQPGGGRKRISSLKTEGRYSNGEAKAPATTLIELDNTSLVYGNSRLEGDCSFYNLSQPRIHHNIRLELDLEDLQNLTGMDIPVENMQGIVTAEIETAGFQQSMSRIGRKNLLRNDYKAKIRIENAGFSLPASSIVCRDLSGDLSYEDHLQIGAMNAVLAGNSINFTGRGDNVREFLFSDRGNLWLDLDVYAHKAELDSLFGVSDRAAVQPGKDTIRFPGRLYLKSHFWLDELEFRDFSAGNVTGDFFYQPRRLTVNSLDFTAMEGLVSAETVLEKQNNGRYLFKVKSDVSGIDIHELFASFNNFGQDFIMDKHLKGNLSGQVNFSTALTDVMKVDRESILADCDVIIRNGELIGFEPMQKLSGFIEVEELENVRFSTLTNQIFISDGQVRIPTMDIRSSAFDIKGSGIHGFDGNFEYKIKVSLSELLSGKAKKPDRQAEEFGAIEDDGLGRIYVYLIVEGTPESINVRYDRRGAINNVREQLSEEKKTVKAILNEEFGLFKKDSALFRESETRESPAFIIEWEDEPDDGSRESTLQKDNKQNIQEFEIQWDDTDTLEEGPELK